MSEKSIHNISFQVHVFRRVQGLEEDLEKTEERLLLANQKLDKVKTIVMEDDI